VGKKKKKNERFIWERKRDFWEKVHRLTETSHLNVWGKQSKKKKEKAKLHKSEQSQPSVSRVKYATEDENGMQNSACSNPRGLMAGEKKKRRKERSLTARLKTDSRSGPCQPLSRETRGGEGGKKAAKIPQTPPGVPRQFPKNLLAGTADLKN